MMRRTRYFVALLLVAACGGRGRGTSSTSVSAPQSPVPDRLFGIVLRQPLNTGVLSGQHCFTGRQFALEDGFYEIVADDILLSAPEEHQDTAAVLAALDSFTVCRGRTRELDATAIVTLSDSVVAHVIIYWPDGNAPSYDRMFATVTASFGEPYQNAWGVRYWAADSMDIYVSKRSIYGAGTSVALDDARSCVRYERLVHRNNTRDHRSYPCWKEPERLDPGEVFTEPPVMLADSDLIVSKVAFRADSAQVRRVWGAPASTDSLSWTYPGLRIWLEEGRVNVIVLTTPKYATARGLRVGDPVRRAKALYGTPCIKELWVYCRNSLDEPEGHGIMLTVENHVIKEILVGVTVVSE